MTSKIQVTELTTGHCQQGRVTLGLQNAEGPPIESFGLVQLALLNECLSQIIQAGADERVIGSENLLANFQTPFEKGCGTHGFSYVAVQGAQTVEAEREIEASRRSRLLFQGDRPPKEPLRLRVMAFDAKEVAQTVQGYGDLLGRRIRQDFPGA
jgi:hypothetical protein